MRCRTLPLVRVVGAVLGVAVLAGCVAIPTTGPIRTGDVVVEEPGVAFPLANDPIVDATPLELVSGFLSAGAAGLGDEWAAARKYLTLTAGATWNPRAQVLVYPSRSAGPEVQERDDGSVLVTVPVEGKVGASGVYQEAVSGQAREALVFELRREANDQWRISTLDDGVVMPEGTFELLYRPTPVYFVSPDRTHLIPDLRWFPANKAATSAVAELLAGPSPWLRDAVRSGAAEGSGLSTGAVTVSEDGVASVDLSAEANLARQGDRDLLQAQLEATLENLPEVRDVRITVGGVPWEPSDVPDLDRDVAPTTGPYVLAEDRLAVLRGGDVEPVADAVPLTGLDAHDPAVSPDEDATIRVVLDGSSRLVLLPPAQGPPVTLLTGESLVAPSVDRHGWVWTGEPASGGRLRVVSAAGAEIVVPTPWLEGRLLRSLRVSRDGARLAVVSTDAAGRDAVVDVAGIARDEAGVPELVGERLRVGASLTAATEVTWVDEVTVAVLGMSGNLGAPTMHLIPVGGPSEALPLRDGTQDIAAGRGDRALYLADADGDLLSQQGTSWVVVASGVRDPAFPG